MGGFCDSNFWNVMSEQMGFLTMYEVFSKGF